MKSGAPGRILMTADAVGGVWRYALELASGLTLRDVSIVLAVLGPEPDERQRKEAHGIPGLQLITTGWALDWTAMYEWELDQIASLVAELADDLTANTVHLHTPALVGDVSWPVPVVAVVHSCVSTWWQSVRGGPLPASVMWHHRATGRGIARADAVIAPSFSFAEQLRQLYRTTRTIDVVQNGRRPLMVNGKQRRLGVMTAGRLWDDGKNIALLDQVALRLGARVRAAGPILGPHGANVQFRAIEALGVLDQAQLGEELASAGVFACPSRYEPFGLGVLEAAQLGTALVLSDIPTFRELWDGAALFVNPVSVHAWANTLGALLDCPGDLADLGTRAAAQARRFSQAAMVDATLDVHRSVLTTPVAQ
jgi:glycogen synthase